MGFAADATGSSPGCAAAAMGAAAANDGPAGFAVAASGPDGFATVAATADAAAEAGPAGLAAAGDAAKAAADGPPGFGAVTEGFAAGTVAAGLPEPVAACRLERAVGRAGEVSPLAATPGVETALAGAAPCPSVERVPTGLTPALSSLARGEATLMGLAATAPLCTPAPAATSSCADAAAGSIAADDRDTRSGGGAEAAGRGREGDAADAGIGTPAKPRWLGSGAAVLVNLTTAGGGPPGDRGTSAVVRPSTAVYLGRDDVASACGRAPVTTRARSRSSACLGGGRGAPSGPRLAAASAAARCMPRSCIVKVLKKGSPLTRETGRRRSVSTTTCSVGSGPWPTGKDPTAPSAPGDFPYA